MWAPSFCSVLCALLWLSLWVGPSCPFSCSCNLFTNHLLTSTYSHPLPRRWVSTGSGRGWHSSLWPMAATLTVTLLCRYPALTQHLEIYPQTLCENSPHLTQKKASRSCCLSEWQRTLLCDLIAPSLPRVPGHHSFEKRLHTMLILARFLKS